jgi:hypothetical protein
MVALLPFDGSKATMLHSPVPVPCGASTIRCQ